MVFSARLLTIICVFVIGEVSAFQFTSDFNAGIYWSSFPIGMINYSEDESEGTLLSSLVTKAEREWEDAVARNVWSIGADFQSGQPSGNSIRWSNDFANETGFNPDTTLAVTVRYRSGTFFTQAEIILNGSNQALRANVNNILYQTLLHELGHVVGLDHSSYDDAIMYASLNGNNQLSNDDQEGALALVDESIYRQSVGFISGLAKGESKEGNALACGSVSFLDDKGGPGPLAALPTLMITFLLTVLFARFSTRSRKFLPTI